ncbi:TauD/TfdA family dioxygenase [Gordonia alkanivorans]|uniref:TauD/TfdA family dioxygenase n=1 Tax=Gordonia alkanivorans TaxID=84096 RepID=UPI0012F4B7CE|nr:TauD/TfdA family dioxygenase [Gordonia alkanivorans]
MCAARAAVLSAHVLWPAFGLEPAPYGTDSLDALAARLTSRSSEQGVAVLDIGRPLTADALVQLGWRMGTVLAERDPAVTSFCENEYVLNLRSTEDAGDFELQPFSPRELFAHTEASHRPSGQRPTWIVLQCLTANEDDASAQTVAIAMDAVARCLSAVQLETLRSTQRVGSSHPVVECDAPVFALRDPSVTDDRFTSDSGKEAADAAVLAAMKAVYQTRLVRRIPWRPGVIAAIDNTKVFHARTAGEPHGSRHLQRVRVRRVG